MEASNEHRRKVELEEKKKLKEKADYEEKIKILENKIAQIYAEISRSEEER